MTALPKYMTASRFDRSLALQGTGSSALTPRDRKLEQMLQLASEMGFVCEPVTKFRQEFLSAISKHLVHRLGKNVYQSPAFNIPMFSKTAAETMFGEPHKVPTKKGTVTWRIEEMGDLSAFMGQMLSETGKMSAGLSRALQTNSEKVARVLATIVPPFEVSVVEMPRGVDRMFINFIYVLSDEDGEVHWPKDDQRRELEFTNQQETKIRRKVLADARRLLQQGVPLSSGWLRQLGMESQAVEMAAAEQRGTAPPKLLQAGPPHLTHSSAAVTRALRSVQAPPKRKRNEFMIEGIVGEWKSATKASKMYLVRWAGLVHLVNNVASVGFGSALVLLRRLEPPCASELQPSCKRAVVVWVASEGLPWA